MPPETETPLVDARAELCAGAGPVGDSFAAVAASGVGLWAVATTRVRLVAAESDGRHLFLQGLLLAFDHLIQLAQRC